MKVALHRSPTVLPACGMSRANPPDADARAEISSLLSASMTCNCLERPASHAPELLIIVHHQDFGSLFLRTPFCDCSSSLIGGRIIAVFNGSNIHEGISLTY